MIIPTGISALAATAALVYVGSMKWLKTVHVRIESDKIRKGAAVRILHISDLHGNSPKRLNLNIWKKINATKFDFVAITGDLVLDYPDELNPHIEMLTALAKKTKIYYVDGNHEKFIYADIKKKLEGLGVTVLCNEQVTENINGNTLNIAGVRDWYWLKKNKFDIAGVLKPCSKVGEGSFTLLLSHQPQIIELAKNYEPDLILCGHTHGGQIRLPGLSTLYAPGQGFFPKYSHGIYEEKNSRMFISKGIGATNFRVRFYNRPEIAIVTLVGSETGR